MRPSWLSSLYKVSLIILFFSIAKFNLIRIPVFGGLKKSYLDLKKKKKDAARGIPLSSPLSASNVGIPLASYTVLQDLISPRC
jgi:hypothetical protein